MKRAVLAVLACAGCLDGIDPEWQLDHDRLVAVRATPPHVLPGQIAQLDALVAHKGGPTDLEQPLTATAVGAPGDLFTAVNDVFGTWEVICPDDAQLDPARAALGLDPGAPVPLQVTLQFPESNGHPLLAQKVVWLGDSQDNPTLGAVTVDGAPPAAALTVPLDVDVPLAIDADPTWQVDWLTSVGTMHDDNEHSAFVHVKPTDPLLQGELAVVLRDLDGGVVWQVWPIQAQ